MAPLDANTLAKFAHGMADNLLVRAFTETAHRTAHTYSDCRLVFSAHGTFIMKSDQCCLHLP